MRLNVYAGLAGFYLLRDNRDTGFANNPITLPAGPYEQEMMLADRQFDTNGQLYFPDSDNPANLNGPPGNPDKHPFWIPEFFGDVITVNGKSWPTMSVEPRRYRFRFVNASNARFYIMQLFNQQGVDQHTNGAAGPAIWQIGSDGGFLNNPVKLADPANGNGQCSTNGDPNGDREQRRHPCGRPLPVHGARRAGRRDHRLRRPERAGRSRSRTSRSSRSRAAARSASARRTRRRTAW